MEDTKTSKQLKEVIMKFVIVLKEVIRFMMLKVEYNQSPLEYELTKKTELTEELQGKNGILANEKFN